MPELSRTVVLDRLPDSITVDASEAERAAVADRLRIRSIESLWCRFELRPLGGGRLAAEGELRASVVQSCVVTLEPVQQEVSERFNVVFVPEGTESDDLDLDAPDELPYGPVGPDLGEATTEQLSLALDPYPRAVGAELEAEAQEPLEHPFARLGALRRPS